MAAAPAEQQLGAVRQLQVTAASDDIIHNLPVYIKGVDLLLVGLQAVVAGVSMPVGLLL